MSKIVEKHLEDFSPFAGDTPLEKLGHGIEEIIRSGDLVTDQAGVKTIILKDKGKEFRVGVSQGWEHKGKNYWIVTAYENRKSPAQKFDQVATKSRHGSDLAQKDLSDSTTSPLKGKSRLQQALEAQQAELEAKEQEMKAKALQDKENADQWRAKLAQITKEKQALAGLKDNDRLLQVGASVPMQRLEVKSSVSLDDSHITPLDYAIIKATDIKPNFTSHTGTQTRMQTDRAIVEKIAKDFDPQKVFLRGGFDDLPVVLEDGQVLAGNHRVQGMLEFSPQSRAKYEQAVFAHYKVHLQPDELLVRTPTNALSSKELLNLAMASNVERASTQGDKEAIHFYKQSLTIKE
ncbi:hypothetical protein NHP21005_11830 [Helicobacter sp. NHP21005]|nr:hypothetical protein NHP21005_11830 [Helicobacter sp. NHP21005]